MEKLKVVIIEDDPEFRKYLHLLLWWYCRDMIQIVAEAATVAQGIQAVSEYMPDIILLDMELPDGIGYDVLNAFKEDVIRNRFFTLIISAFESYRAKAFRYRVVEYLLKDFTDQEFCDTIVHLLEIIQAHSSVNEPAKEPFVLLRTQQGLLRINPATIVFCKAQAKGTVLRLQNGKDETIGMLLSDVEQALRSHNFLRIHRSHCVNVGFVKAIHSLDNRNKASVEISKEAVKPHESALLPVGDTYLEGVRAFFYHQNDYKQ
jgi:two-component system LytT family response regulator